MLIKRKMISRGVDLWGRTLIDTVTSNNNFDAPTDLQDVVAELKSILMNDVLEQIGIKELPIAILGFDHNGGICQDILKSLPEGDPFATKYRRKLYTLMY